MISPDEGGFESVFPVSSPFANSLAIAKPPYEELLA
jgi:hypothetical protein